MFASVLALGTLAAGFATATLAIFAFGDYTHVGNIAGILSFLAISSISATAAASIIDKNILKPKG